MKKNRLCLLYYKIYKKSCGPFFDHCAVVKVKVLTYLIHINYNVGVLGTIPILRQQKDLVGGLIGK